MSKNKNNKPVWSTRIKKSSSSLFAKIGSSINVDKRLYKQDILASSVHVEMLFKKKIISLQVKNKIIWGLKKILNEINKKKFSFNDQSEDIHMSIEKRLFDLWKLHAYQRRLMRKTGFRIQEARSYFLHAAFHIWYANSLFVLIQNRSLALFNP